MSKLKRLRFSLKETILCYEFIHFKANASCSCLKFKFFRQTLKTRLDDKWIRGKKTSSIADVFLKYMIITSKLFFTYYGIILQGYF
jgi:hypothetical protein